MVTSTEPGTLPPAEDTRSGGTRAPDVSSGPRSSSLGASLGMGLGMGLATAVLLAWSLSRPALWFDEAASVVATQRTWPDLWKLLHGTDAPLVPYYALVKLGTGLVTQVHPGAAAHPEILFRLPSAVAVIAAAALLIAWLARQAPARVAVGTGVVLLLTVSVSRYGQEARPYAFVFLTAVLSSVAWAWAARDPRRWPLLVYALAVAAMVASNALSVTLVAAHLVVALTLTARTARRTVAGAALGVVAVAPFTLLATLNGGGPERLPDVDYELLRETFAQLFTADRTPFLGYGYLVALGLLGATRVFDHQYRFIARLALAWVAIPPLVLLPAVFLRPGLLIARYLLFVVPGWAILGGLGIATIVDAVRRLVGVGTRSTWVGTAAAAIAVAGLVAGLVHTQLPSQERIRTSHGHGHGVDPRQALPDLRRPGWTGLPVIVTTRALGLQLSAYDQPSARRMQGVAAQWSGRNIWPTVPSAEAAQQTYVRLPRAIALLELRNLEPGCKRAPRAERVAWAQRCLPLPLKTAGFQVTDVRVHGRDVVTEVLTKPR